jgi:hypothetical protein
MSSICRRRLSAHCFKARTIGIKQLERRRQNGDCSKQRTYPFIPKTEFTICCLEHLSNQIQPPSTQTTSSDDDDEEATGWYYLVVRNFQLSKDAADDNQ